MTTAAPFGAWTSPISAADTVRGLVGFSDIVSDGDDLFWIELRPSEGGRQVIVRRTPDGAISDLVPAPWNIRSRVHEYGGAPFAARNGEVVFSEWASQRLHRTADPPVPVTADPPRPGSIRFADGRILSDGSIVCVRETHDGTDEPRNELVRVDVGTGSATVLASGRDFYAAPRPSPDERVLAWIEWDHPNMPWDGTDLRLGVLGDDGLAEVVTVTGGPDESVGQPEWDTDGSLLFATDRTGWWNVERWRHGRPDPVFPMEADVGDPAWVFGRASFGVLSGGRLVMAFWDSGRHRLGLLEDGDLRIYDTPFSEHRGIVTNRNDTVWFVGRRPDAPTGVVEMDAASGRWTEITANPRRMDPEWTPVPELIDFPTTGGATAHGVYYPPTNPRFEGPAGARPPLVVKAHGGPTAHTAPTHSLADAFWTSRGFGVVDVNYRGSSGFGRAYRRALDGQWGVADVEDCLAAARFLADRGDVDGARLTIRGGSAGGFTTLAALAFGDAFSAGASYYGISDIELLAAHTHKFESRYLERLVGPDRAVWQSRSPLYSADRIRVPVILFHGSEDRVVPPEQAESIARALAGNRVPHALVVYKGEDHGFRMEEHLVHSLESELAFYGRVLGFTPAEELPDVPLVGG